MCGNDAVYVVAGFSASRFDALIRSVAFAKRSGKCMSSSYGKAELNILEMSSVAIVCRCASRWLKR
jgi:hypothetical protein